MIRYPIALAFPAILRTSETEAVVALVSDTCELESIGQRRSFAVIRLPYGFCAGQLSYPLPIPTGLSGVLDKRGTHHANELRWHRKRRDRDDKLNGVAGVDRRLLKIVCNVFDGNGLYSYRTSSQPGNATGFVKFDCGTE